MTWERLLLLLLLLRLLLLFEIVVVWECCCCLNCCCLWLLLCEIVVVWGCCCLICTCVFPSDICVVDWHSCIITVPSSQVYQTQQLVLLPPELDAQTRGVLHCPQAHEDLPRHLGIILIWNSRPASCGQQVQAIPPSAWRERPSNACWSLLQVPLQVCQDQPGEPASPLQAHGLPAGACREVPRYVRIQVLLYVCMYTVRSSRWYAKIAERNVSFLVI